MTHRNLFERVLLTGTTIAAACLWGLWASATPAQLAEVQDELDTCFALYSEDEVAWSHCLLAPVAKEEPCYGETDWRHACSCGSTAELHYAIALDLGIDADAAYEDAIAVCRADRRGAP